MQSARRRTLDGGPLEIAKCYRFVRQGEQPIVNAPDTLAGGSIKWTGAHHSARGDFADISTRVVIYETGETCYVTAGGKLVGDPYTPVGAVRRNWLEPAAGRS
jgi:hypothetical protein